MRLLILLLTSFVLSPSFADTPLKANNGYVPEAPPTARVMTAYMTLENTQDNPVKIKRIESPQFGRVEMHTSIEENGISSMKALPFIQVDNNFTLEPGGAHLMLFNPTSRLTAGDCVELILHFDNDTKQNLRLSVEKRKVVSHHHHH